MAHLPELNNRIVTQNIELPRNQLKIDKSLNPRQNYGNLGRLGAALDACQQTTPIIVVPDPMDSEVYWVRDGFRRIIAVDQGYAPHFESRNTWWKCIVLRTPAGITPPERDIRRWCATTNINRKNWLPVERAKFYDLEIQDAITDRIDEINSKLAPEHHITKLTAKDEGKIRKETMLQLAAMEGFKCDQTIRNHLELLKCPPCIKIQLYKNNLSANAAKRFVGMSEEQAQEILRKAAYVEGVDLTESQIPGDVDAFSYSSDNEWLQPAKPSKKKTTRTIRAKVIDQIKREHGLNKKPTAPTPRSPKEMQQLIDALNNSDDLSKIEEYTLQILNWAKGENPEFPDYS